MFPDARVRSRGGNFCRERHAPPSGPACQREPTDSALHPRASGAQICRSRPMTSVEAAWCPLRDRVTIRRTTIAFAPWWAHRLDLYADPHSQSGKPAARQQWAVSGFPVQVCLLLASSGPRAPRRGRRTALDADPGSRREEPQFLFTLLMLRSWSDLSALDTFQDGVFDLRQQGRELGAPEVLQDVV